MVDGAGHRGGPRMILSTRPTQSFAASLKGCFSHLAFRIPVYALVAVGIFISSPTCKAIDAPPVEQLQQDSIELGAASTNVQGAIRVYRSDTANPAAFEKLPTEIAMPLTLSGQLWRSTSRFRADYKQFRPTKTVKETQAAVGMDGNEVYEFSSGAMPDSGALRICDLGTPEANTATKFVKATFFDPVDALWSQGGVPFVDLLQRPSTRLVLSKMFPGGFAMEVATEDGTKGQFEFEAPSPHPLGYIVSSVTAGKLSAKSERRVFSAQKYGRWYPTRIVDISQAGGASYTQVVVLDLEPLQTDSPIAQPISDASFQNLGIGYRAYKVGRPPRPGEVAHYEAHGGTSPMMPPAEHTSHSAFLWLNALLILRFFV